jgi:hypothetical protein
MHPQLAQKKNEWMPLCSFWIYIIHLNCFDLLLYHSLHFIP